MYVEAPFEVEHNNIVLTSGRFKRNVCFVWDLIPYAVLLLQSVKGKIIGIVAVVYEFTGESSWLIQLTSVLFAKSGFATYAIDHQGHGFSEGLSLPPDLQKSIGTLGQALRSGRAQYVSALFATCYGCLLPVLEVPSRGTVQIYSDL
ncbi:unnamed protein product [Camellia sinensis]